MKWTTEAKVGAFSLAAGGLFLYTMLFLGHTDLFSSKGMELTGEFSSVTGLKDGNGVRYSGVPVGKVKDIRVGKKGVIVEMELEKDISIPVDSRISLQSDGILGEKYVAITPGKSPHTLRSGSVVQGDSADDMDKAVAQMNQVMIQAELLLSSMNRVMGDEKTQEALKGAIHNANAMTANMAAMAGQMNQMMAANQQNVNVMANNMAQMSQNMNSLTKQLDESMRTLDGDGKSTQNIRHILQNMQETTKSMNQIAKSFEGLATDPQSMQDIKTTLHNTAHLTSTLSTVTGGGAMKGMSDVQGELLYSSQGNRYSANVNARFFGKENLFTLGASHMGDDTRLDFTGGKFLTPNVSARIGFFEGDVGASLDYGLRDKPIKFTFALMNPNDFRYYARAEFKLTDSLFGVAQLNRPFNKDFGGNYYGIGYRF